jgi:N-acyl-L-homoserine lactone synthetase
MAAVLLNTASSRQVLERDTMLQVVSNRDRGRFTAALAQMYRHRKTVFIDRLGWDLPVTDGQYEIDQFDGDAAVYLLATDDQGAHTGSLRLLPTTHPHLLSEVFPDLCEAGVPRGADIWEITRLCTAPDLADPRPVRQALLLGVVEYALAAGIRRYTCMTHVPYLNAVLAVGWDCAPLGLPREDAGVTVGAISIEVTPQTLDVVRHRTGHMAPVLSWDNRRAA